MSGAGAWRVVSLLFLGQLVSLNLAVSSFTSSLIAYHGVNAQLTQTFFMYASLGLVYGVTLLYQRRRLLVPWYWYLLLAFVDVQGNYLVAKAYQYSSITSVALLDCWTIPWVMILTWFALRSRYSLGQFVGAAICVVGLGLVILSDSKKSDGGGRKPLLGDALVIAGTFCYAFSNVGEEFCVKKKSQVEAIAMIGLFGMLVSACEIPFFERKDIEAIKWSSTIIGLFAGYATSGFIFYTIVPFVLKMGGSTLFNLSLLTSDLWAVTIKIFFYKQQVNWLYYLAYGVVAVGLVIYSLTEKVSAETENSMNEVIEYAPIKEEDPSDVDNASSA